MFNKKVLLAIVIGSVFLGGCASSPNEELQERLALMEEQRLELEQDRIELETKKREAEVDALPPWVLEPPQMDATGVYGIGISESKKISHGLKAARLQAEFALAKVFKQELSGSERAFEQGDNNGDVAAQTTFLIDKIVDAVPVVGYQVIQQEVKIINGQHNVFVLLKMPFDQFNKVLQMEKAKELDSKVQASFDDLERRLDKRRAQKESETQANFERQQQAVSDRNQAMKENAEIVVGETPLPINQ
jgi:outer membrane murein-binding lipoprotein Lpp